MSKGHYVRLSPEIESQISRLGLNNVSKADLIRLALTEYLSACERTGYRPSLPSTIPRKPTKHKIIFEVGELVNIPEGQAEIISISKGWFRLKVRGQEKLIFKQKSDLKKIEKIEESKDKK